MRERQAPGELTGGGQSRQGADRWAESPRRGAVWRKAKQKLAVPVQGRGGCGGRVRPGRLTVRELQTQDER